MGGLKVEFVEGTTINDVWFKLMVKLLTEPHREYIVEDGSFAGDTRLEFDFVVVRITNPSGSYPGYDPSNLRRLLPELPPNVAPPIDEKMLWDYFSSYMLGNCIHGKEDKIISMYSVYKNTNQCCIQIATTDDINLLYPPCLRHIDTKIVNNKLHFFPYFRSWDLWGGFPLNVAALQLLKECMVSLLEIEDGEIVASSKSLHIYGHTKKYLREVGYIIS
ncbi:MAG: thymidylate synthase [Thermoplasmata archaeon]